MKDFFRDYGTLLVFGLQIVWFFLSWWFAQAVARKDHLDTVAQRVTALELSRPSRADLTALTVDMADMRGEMKEFAATIEGARQTFSAKIDGATSLLTRTENQLQMITRHLLETNS